MATASNGSANAAGSVATFGTGFTPPEAEFVTFVRRVDAVSVAQQPMCSSSGTAFATPHSKILGSVFEEPGWRIERFSYLCI